MAKFIIIGVGSKIPNVHWKSRSDTETVELVEYLGIENAGTAWDVRIRCLGQERVNSL